MRQGESSFTRRFGLADSSKSLIYDDLPQGTRHAIVNILHDNLWLSGEFLELYRMFCTEHRVLYKDIYESEAKNIINAVVMAFSWHEVLSICEFACRATRNRGEFEGELNRLFAEDAIGWRLCGGVFERLTAEPVQQRIEAAREILREPQFAGPNEQFAKAIKFISEHPQPDCENCVKDAVGALEGVVKIVSDRTKEKDFDKLIKGFVKAGLIPKPLDGLFDKVYGYRSNLEGAAHARVMSTPSASVQEAELVLGVCGSLIVYLVNKHKSQQRGGPS